MIRFGDLSLRAKLVGLVALVTLFSLGSAMAFLVVRDVRSFKKDMVDRTILVARVVGDYSVPDLEFQDRKASGQTLALLKGLPDVRYAALYDVSGELFSTFQSAPAVKIPPRPEAMEATFSEGLLHVGVFVAVPGEGTATLALGVSSAPLDERIRTHVLAALGAAVGILLVAVFLAVALQKVISAPLLALAATARRISRLPDYSVRVERQSADEIGALCDAFNEMLGEIQRREEERERADRRTREKSLFLAHMSHELRTPLNSIIGFSDVLLGTTREKIAPRERRFLENINGAGKHLLRIINNVLDLSKIEAGRMDLLLETFSVKEAVEGVVAVMKETADRRGITFLVDVPDDLPPMTADELKVKEIVYNLLSNAVKFSHEGSSVAVAVRRAELPEPGIELDVRDQGIGIHPKHHALIFQEFRQVDASEARRFEGTGLGLALVKRYVELMGGRLHLESEPGKGSVFTVVLPLEVKAPPADPTTSLRKAPG